MLIFIAIAVASFLIVAGSFFFGGEGGEGADGVDHEHPDHTDLDAGAEPTIGIFSVKVIGTLTMGFGAAGAIARQYGADYLISSLIGVGSGLLLGGTMYLMLLLIYRQQSSSTGSQESAIGSRGIVRTSIGADTPGEVSVSIGGQYRVYVAKSANGAVIPRGETVEVTAIVGGELVVRQVTATTM